MKELKSKNDFDIAARSDGVIVRSRDDYSGITIHSPQCEELREEFTKHLQSNDVTSEETFLYNHVDTLNDALEIFNWNLQPNPYCRTCRPRDN